MKPAKHFVCISCGWFGKQPDKTGNQYSQELCPDCGSDTIITPLYENPFDQFNPYSNQQRIGVGSRVWAFGYDNYGTVLSYTKDRVRIAWPVDYGRTIRSYHKIDHLGWVKPTMIRKQNGKGI